MQILNSMFFFRAPDGVLRHYFIRL